MKRFIFFFSILFFCRGAAAVEVCPSAVPESPAESPQWLALGHYQPKFFGGYKSSIDTPDFFLSEEGKTSPLAELESTIALFNSQDNAKKCLFPARYAFLKREGLIKTKFPKCKEYEQFVDDLQPSGVTLLFTDAYMNNPASLFGHTLLRIDTGRKGTQLLAHGANYGAFTGEENGMLFAINGLVGGYYGGFTIKPYYDTINLYNNIENRDIWELSLDFTPEELERFVAHLWEVGHAQSKYYFFTKNCSYMLMEVLDAARPELRLAKQFPAQTIPLDTFRAANSRKGLVKGVNYRPSRQAKIIHQYKQLHPKQRAAYSKIIKKDEFDLKNLNDAEKAGVLDTAYQFVQYQYVEKEMDIEAYRGKSFKLLTARSGIKDKDALEPLTEGKTPLESHKSMRASVGAGFRNGEAFQEIAYRPAYHSLSDNTYGYRFGAEINFLETTFRHYDNQDKTVLQNLDLVKIKSISPVSEMFFPYSYNIRLNVEREMNPRTEDEGYVFNLQLGVGVATDITDNILAYFMINNHLAYGGFLPRDQYAGMGGAAGLYADFGSWRLLGEAEKVLATDKFGSRTTYAAELTYSLNADNTLGFRYSFEHNYGRNISEPMVEFRRHF